MKYLKKWMALFIVLALIVAGMDYGRTYIKAAENPRVYADNIAALAGDEISIPVKISGNTGIMGIGVKVTYDKEVLIPQNVTIGSILSGTFDHNVKESTENSFNILWAGTDNVSEDGELFVMTFKVANAAQAGSTDIKLSYTEGDTFKLDGNDYTDIALDCQNIAVTIGGSAATTPSPSGNKTPSPAEDVLDDFHVYLGYTNNSWTESFFHQEKPGIVISGDGDYTFSYTVQETDSDIHILLLETDLEYFDVVNRLKIVPTKLTCGGENYSVKEYSIAYETQENGRNAYRIIFRNPYMGEFEGLGGVKIPVTAGDKIVIDFTVEGMGKKADIKGTDTPTETAPTETETSKPAPSEPASSVSPSATPQTAATSGPGVTAEPKEDTQHITVKKPARVKIKKIRRAGRGCAKVIWKKVKCSDGYQIQYSRRRSFSGKKKTTSDGKSAYIFGKPKKKYYVRVRAVNSGWITQTSYGNKYGRWSKVKKIKLK